MKKEEIFEKVKKTICDSIPDVNSSSITGETIINNEKALDSMGFILIICKIEAIFDIKIPDRQWKKILTINDLVNYIESKVK